MLAKELVEQFGDKLKGRMILTYPFGAWPGGRARVTEIAPDPQAPEIVFEVRGLSPEVQKAIRQGELNDELIGVFFDEEVELVS